MDRFAVLYSPRAARDLARIGLPDALTIQNEINQFLAEDPFPFKKRIRRIKNVSPPLYRLRVDGEQDSYRVFYAIESRDVIILRVVKKKDADKILTPILPR